MSKRSVIWSLFQNHSLICWPTLPFNNLSSTPLNVHKILGFEILRSEKHTCRRNLWNFPLKKKSRGEKTERGKQRYALGRKGLQGTVYCGLPADGSTHRIHMQRPWVVVLSRLVAKYARALTHKAIWRNAYLHPWSRGCVGDADGSER